MTDYRDTVLSDKDKVGGWLLASAPAYCMRLKCVELEKETGENSSSTLWYSENYTLHSDASRSSFTTIRVEMFRLLTTSFHQFSTIVSLPSIAPPSTLLRTIGPVGDRRFEIVSEACDGANCQNFEFGVCSILIACIYDTLDEAFKAV